MIDYKSVRWRPQTKSNVGQQLHYASSHVVIKFVLTLTYDNLLK